MIQNYTMKDQLQDRLQALKTEYDAGQKVLAELEAKQASVRDTLLRISGAIQVLEETLAEAEASEANATSNGGGDGAAPATAAIAELV